MAYTVKDYNNTGNNATDDVYGTAWVSQTFTAGSTYTATRLRLKLYRVGSPGAVVVSLRATSAGSPTGSDLCVGVLSGNDLTTDTAGAWYSIMLGSGTSITSAGVYAVVIRATSGDVSNKIVWNVYDTGSGNYAGGSVFTSANSGSSWSADTSQDGMFETYSGTMPEQFVQRVVVASNNQIWYESI